MTLLDSSKQICQINIKVCEATKCIIVVIVTMFYQGAESINFIDIPFVVLIDNATNKNSHKQLNIFTIKTKYIHAVEGED